MTKRKGRYHSLTTSWFFGGVIDHGQIGREEIHDRSVDIRFQRLPLNVVVLFSDGDEIRAQKDRFHAFDSKQLSKRDFR